MIDRSRISLEHDTLESVLDRDYDLAVFASGYEERCTAIASQISRRSVRDVAVMGFAESKKSQQRIDNDRYFAGSAWGADLEEFYDYDCAGYSVLARYWESKPSAILIDYSSMSRTWYASILNWMRIAPVSWPITIDFVYAVAEYSADYDPLVVTDVAHVPGFYGAQSAERPSLLGLGLGFDAVSSLSVIERLMPDKILAFVAAPSISPWYVDTALIKNRPILSAYTTSKSAIPAPLTNVRAAFGVLADAIGPHRDTHDVTLVPLGPKPHVLATLLLAMQFPGFGCLRVSGRRPEKVRVQASEHRVVVRVHIRPRPERRP